MKFRNRVVSMMVMIVLLGTSVAMAVGYQRYEIDPADQTKPVAKAPDCQDLGQAIKEASFLEKYPAVIDRVVLFVKDLLGQFGLVKSTAP